MPISDHSHPKIIKVIINFSWICIFMQKIHPFIHPFTFWPGWPQPFLTKPTPIFSYQLLISGIKKKKQTISSPCSRDIFDCKSYNLIGQHHFGPVWQIQTNRFTDFTFGWKDDREVRWKKTKNEFHHHVQIIAWC